MKAFKAFWLCALENGNTSAEDVWRGCLEYLRSKADSYIDHCDMEYPIIQAVPVSVIEDELNE